MLIAQDEEVWRRADEAERAGYYTAHEAFETAVREAGGKVESSEALRSVTAATTYRRRGTEELVTDGPFAELAEQLGGFYVLDMPDLDAVVAAVRHLPEYTLEIRPVAEL
ncbi:YciI family protein [Actinotalea sp. AC32]|nr:YciI family protein [Actinotalea sp. AC32]